MSIESSSYKMLTVFYSVIMSQYKGVMLDDFSICTVVFAVAWYATHTGKAFFFFFKQKN
jgi:hypothetical protein